LEEKQGPIKPASLENNRNAFNQQISPMEGQVEPVVVGIASAFGDYWQCVPDDPRAYTDVYQYLSWIQDITGIEPTSTRSK